MREFRDRVAVVTGGASGIGLAMAERFTREGMKLVLADVEKGPLGEVTARFRADGVEVLGVHTDVSDAEQMDALGAATLDAFGAAHPARDSALRHVVPAVGAQGLSQGLLRFVARELERAGYCFVELHDSSVI